MRQPANSCGELLSSLHSWKVTPAGQPSLLANLPGDLFSPGVRGPTASPITAAGFMSPTAP
jgi:hypothetical protein